MAGTLAPFDDTPVTLPRRIDDVWRDKLQEATAFLAVASPLAAMALVVPAFLTPTRTNGTIPLQAAVFAVRLVAGTPAELGLGSLERVLLALTLVLWRMTFSGVPTNILLGAARRVMVLAKLLLALDARVAAVTGTTPHT